MSERFDIVTFEISTEVGTSRLHIDVSYNENLFKDKKDIKKLQAIAQKVLEEVNNFYEE